MNTHIFDSWHLPHMSHGLDIRDKEDLKAIAMFSTGVLLGTLLFVAFLNAVFDWGIPLLPAIG
ncbi:hypothetical protein GCM10007205_04450 [Oxalicibacterium flavum]|uniref:Uncharacterized protein n=1 Tax=Oxalicibacterium flavum TaxID=179467 RepID=A0A8J2UL79_9BURK|nr:hypothetical protein [Oxalicibacterium flavum]GGB98250.1 hypothetical protein GCM10007205_04450 [Oxalicibacterium flavum]